MTGEQQTKWRAVTRFFGRISKAAVMTSVTPATTRGPQPIWSQEIDLILCCTRAAFGSDETQSIQALAAGGIDWDSLVHKAESLGVLPLLCRCRFPPEAVPARIKVRLESALRLNALRNLFLTSELLEILQLLDQNGIPAIPLKGPTLAALAYGDLALREFSDLDILLRHGDILKATKVLAARQYELRCSFTPEQLEKELRSEHIHHLELVDANRRVLLELHWELMQERFFFTPDLEQLWDHRIQYSLVGTPVNVMDPEDLLIFLCVHGWKHYWLRLSWIADLAGVIGNTSTIDWARLLRRAKDAAARRRVLLGLGLAHRLLRTPIPTLVEKQIQADRTLGEMMLETERTLLLHDSPEPPEGRFEHYWHALSTSDGVKQRARILFTFVWKTARLNDNDFAWITLPRPLFFLYYLLHPVRLAMRAIARAAKRVRDWRSG